MNPTCAHCGSEIVHSNTDDVMLRLSPVPRSGDGPVTDMLLVSELAGPLDFCGMECLCRWAAEQKSPFTGKPYGK